MPKHSTSSKVEVEPRKVAPRQWSIKEGQESEVLNAQRMFGRVLERWVWDVLALQRAGLDQFNWQGHRADDDDGCLEDF